MNILKMNNKKNKNSTTERPGFYLCLYRFARNKFALAAKGKSCNFPLEILSEKSESKFSNLNYKNYFISTKKSLLSKQKVWSLLRECFWSKNIPIEYVQRFINHSLCFGIYQTTNKKLVGFGRVITDYTTYAYVCDITVDPKHRNKGLGSTLVKTIMNYPELQGLKTWSLRTTSEAKKIYEKFGFKIAEHPDTQLEISDLEIYCHAAFVNLHKKYNL